MNITRLVSCGAGLLLSLLAGKAAPVSIEPLGDSITWGYTTASAADSPGGYREPLYANLKLAGFAINYLGANTNNPGPLLTQDNQTHHDGYPKYTITDDNQNLNGDVQPAGKPTNHGGYWLSGTVNRPAIFPDDILLLIGSNDNDGSTPAAVMEQRLEEMLTNIFTLRPHTHLFLATIPPLPLPTDAGKTAIAKLYNGLMKTLTVPKFLSLGYNIRLVDQYTNFILASSPDGDTVNTALFGDNIHPNETGYQLMGDTWSAAILNDPTHPPAAPSDLTALSVSAGQINLNWTDNATNEGAFLIERSPDQTNYSLVGYTGAGITNWMDTGLSPVTTYYYRVRARNAAGDSAYCAVAGATTLNVSPAAAPTGLDASPGYAKAYLNWQAVPDVVNYNVKRSTTNGGPYTTIASPISTNCTDTGLINGSTYYYVVSAVDSFGEGTNSEQVSVTPSGMPVAHYRFEQNTLDSTGNGNNGAPVGGLMYGSGKVGAYSARFDGTSSFIEITPVVRTNFTVAMWIKTTNNATGTAWYDGMGLVDGEVTGSAADWGCSILNSKFAVGIGNPDSTTFSTTNINDGAWHHLAFTRNSDTGVIKLYIDGVLNVTATAATGPRTAPEDLRIGATHAPVPVILNGEIDDLRIYDDVLSVADIAALAYPPAPMIRSLGVTNQNGLPGPLGTGALTLRGFGGNPNAQFLVLNSTNLIMPVNQWKPIATNDFDGNGTFSTTNAFDIEAPAGFFQIQLY